MATQQQGERDDSCLFNREVVCRKKCSNSCGSCGWNPAVAKFRLDKIRAGLLDAAGEEAAKE